MSEENLAVARAGLEAYNRGDLDALKKLYHPDVEFVTLMLGTRRGRDVIDEIYEENRSAISDYKLEPKELIDIGGDQVVAVVGLGGSGRVSEISLGDPIAFLCTIRDGLLVRQQTFRNKEEALEAAEGR